MSDVLTGLTTLSVDQAAQLLGMSKGGVRKQILEGTFAFPSVRSGSRILIAARPIYKFLQIDDNDAPPAA